MNNNNNKNNNNKNHHNNNNSHNSNSNINKNKNNHPNNGQPSYTSKNNTIIATDSKQQTEQLQQQQQAPTGKQVLKNKKQQQEASQVKQTKDKVATTEPAKDTYKSVLQDYDVLILDRTKISRTLNDIRQLLSSEHKFPDVKAEEKPVAPKEVGLVLIGPKNQIQAAEQFLLSTGLQKQKEAGGACGNFVPHHWKKMKCVECGMSKELHGK